ncbi:hypothetical protein D3C72_2012300 [compost metagenome]
MSSASRPEAQVLTAKPSPRNCSDRMSRAEALSSMTSTRSPLARSDKDLPRVSTALDTPSQALNRKQLPQPGADSTWIAPPISSTSRLAIARPSPVPPNRRVVEPSA